MANSAIREALITILKSKRRKLPKSQRHRPHKPTRWLYPWTTEKHYAAAIRGWLRPMTEYVHEYIKNNIEDVLHGDDATLTRNDAIVGKQFRVMVNSLNAWVGQYVPDDPEKKGGSAIYMGLGNIANTVYDFNEAQYEKSAKASLGIEFPVGEEWWPNASATWKDRNYQLIRSDMTKYIGQVNDMTEQAVTAGMSVKQLSKQIQGLDDSIKRSRANFLARDQIGKLNGQITQARMEDAGLSMYIWSTSNDERVRDSHAELEGMLCRWDDPTVYTEDGGKTWKDRPADWVQLHPGQDFQCRCTAIAYWDEIIGEADKALDYEERGTVEEEVQKSLENFAAEEKRKKEQAAIKKTKKQTFTESKTIEEANAYAHDILGIPKVDYAGCDVKTANEWNKSISSTISEFPELKNNLNFVGSIQERNKQIKLCLTDYYEKEIKSNNPYLSEKKVKSYAKSYSAQYMKKYKIKDDASAQSFSANGLLKPFSGITQNAIQGGNSKQYVNSLQYNVKIKYHPEGCDTIKSIVDHEFGHQIDDLLKISDNSDIIKLYVGKTHDELTDGLSQYSWDNPNQKPIKEFISEGWAEYRNNPNPRPIAKKIGETIEKEYVKWEKKNS